MKNVIQFPERGKIEQEAVEWLIRLDGDDEPSEQDLQALKEWMSLSPAHVEELEKLNAFWGNLAILTELNIPLAKPEIAGSLEPVQAQPIWARALSVRNAWAAVVGIFAITMLLQFHVFGALAGKKFDTSNGHYATAIGKQTTIPLADGSQVHLNTNSQILVEYTRDYRNIRLIQGEAHFDVAKNDKQPFRVYAGKERVQAIGTSFTVYLREKDVEVLVTEGKVELATQKPVIDAGASSEANTNMADKAKAIDRDSPGYYLTVPVEKLGYLKEGQGATILVVQNNQPERQVPDQKVELMDAKLVERRDAWRKGLMLFAGDSLEDVVAEIGRYTSVSIEIVDPELKKIRIGGQFRLGDVSGMLEVLEVNFGLSVTMVDNEHVQISAAAKQESSKLF